MHLVPLAEVKFLLVEVGKTLILQYLRPPQQILSLALTCKPMQLILGMAEPSLHGLMLQIQTHKPLSLETCRLKAVLMVAMAVVLRLLDIKLISKAPR